MIKLKSMLTRPLILWGLFILFVGLTFGFSLWTPSIGGTAMDTVTGDGAQQMLSTMTEAQRTSHGWMTLLLDIPYPLAYGLLFAGLAIKAFEKGAVVLAAPSFLVILFDLAENFVQVLALWGGPNLLSLKDVLTPVKYVLFAVAGVIAIVALLVLIIRRVRNSNAG